MRFSTDYNFIQLTIVGSYEPLALFQYIALMVMSSLALLGEIGAIVDIAWEFGALQLFQGDE